MRGEKEKNKRKREKNAKMHIYNRLTTCPKRWHTRGAGKRGKEGLLGLVGWQRYIAMPVGRE